MTDNLKLAAIGIHTTVLIELHLKDPNQFSSEVILDRLIKRYEFWRFEPTDDYGIDG